MRKTVIIPAEVMENEAYKNLSDGARILFGILTEKKEEAKKNDWIDPQGIRYVVFPKRQIQEELDCSRYWVDQFTKELETMGLIKLGYLYKPVIERRFYVRTFGDDIPRILVEYGADESIGEEIKEALINQSVVSTEMRERFAYRGFFCCRIPGTWEKGDQQEHILMIPLHNVCEADDGKTYIAFLDKRHLPFTLRAGDGRPATENFGMSTPDLARQFFQEIEEAELTPERVVDPAKSLAETVTVHIKQPAPPIKVR